MNRINAGGWLVLVIVIILFAMLMFGLSGCTVENRGGRVSLLEPPEPVVIETPDTLTLDTPVFRILETAGGRLRLIAQDPITRRYRVVD